MLSLTELDGFAAQNVALDGFSRSLNTNNSGIAGYTTRCLLTPTRGGRFVRVTFLGSNAAAFNVDNAAIGRASGSGPDCLTIPTELKFNGGSGFSIAAGVAAVSDWTPFPCQAGEVLLTILDNGAANGNMRYLAAGGDGAYFKAASDSHNVAALAGMTFQSGISYCATRLEIMC